MTTTLRATLALTALAIGCASEAPPSQDADSATDSLAADLAAPDVAATEDAPAPSEAASPDAAVDEEVTVDVAADVATDVAADVTSPDDVPDASPPLDASPDAPADASPDRADAPLDARPDAPLDAPLDVRPDAPLDAPLDARPDAPLDAPLDVRPDAPLDARPDAPADVPGDLAPDAPTGPRVDRTNPQLYSLTFRANEADPAARLALGTETAFLDTRVAPRGRLVVYLHGAGAPTTCGSNEHERLLSSWGFHVIGPCYVSDYGVNNCGADIGGCRLEAFEGVDHHPFVNIPPPDAIETRVVRALQLLQRRNPAGDWAYYLDGTRPRWSAIIISGISHGASTSGLIGQVRSVDRAVMLSGPLDTNQAWLARAGMTARSRYWGLTHRGDPQHPGHLAAFTTLGLPGAAVFIDAMTSPYGGSHRLASAAMTTDGHSSTQAGGASPRDAMGRYLFDPAWRLMYGVTP